MTPARPLAAGLVAVVLALQAAWLGWALTVPLADARAQGAEVTRLGLLVGAVPHVIPGRTWAQSYLGQGVANLAHVENLPDRLPIVAAALFIALAATATGGLIVRGLGLATALDRVERVAVGFGVGSPALGVVLLGLGRAGWLGSAIVRVALAAPIVGAGLAGWWGRGRGSPVSVAGERWSNAMRWGLGLIVGPFVVPMFLAAMLPAMDFDALEYHLEAPKEYWLAGRITFLPHNVYAAMPQGVEMIYLAGMAVLGDWWRGALAGQVVVALFAPATAALIARAAGRLFGPGAGWLAAVVYLTTPWVYRLGATPLVEGPLCFAHAALIWVATRVGTADGASRPGRWATLAGLIAGGGLAIKYPGLVTAVIPGAIGAVVLAVRARSPRVVAGFLLGVGVVAGPWLARNLVDTRNPVYPLGYSVFGGPLWSEAREAQWQRAHGRKPVEAAALTDSAVQFFGRSDPMSPLYVALAPVALLVPAGWRRGWWLGAFAAYLFLTWWLLTHRLDRFALPILPGLAILAGAGAAVLGRGRIGAIGLVVLLTVAVGANLAYCSTALAAWNEWTAPLDRLRVEIPRKLNPALARLDAELQGQSKPILVGPAAVFHFSRPVVVNTVFDANILERLTRDQPPNLCRKALQDQGITHLFVDWAEVDRYRSPGNYGFTPFVTPERFDDWVRLGLLGAPTRLGPRQVAYPVLAGSR